MRVVVVVTILAFGLSGCALLDREGEGWTTYGPSVSLTAEEPFVPATRREGGSIVMPVTFPDGATAEVVYDPALRLAERGVRAWGSGGTGDAPDRDFQAVRGVPLDDWIAGEAPIATYPGTDGGTVESWATPDGEPAQRLVFRFGSWSVIMSDDGDAHGWAAGLRGRETENGFLVLEGAGGLHLAAAGEHAGPHLMLGGTGAEFILLMPGWCDARNDRPTRSDGFGSSCLHAGGEDVAVHVYSDDRAFVDAVAAGLRIRGYTAARR